jgi:hypothetical protein
MAGSCREAVQNNEGYYIQRGKKGWSIPKGLQRKRLDRD